MTTDTTSTFASWLAACDRGAALIYHEVVVIEDNVARWRSDNPQLADLFDQAARYVSAMLAANGLQMIPAAILVAQTIGASLKTMASADPSIDTRTAVPAPMAMKGPPP